MSALSPAQGAAAFELLMESHGKGRDTLEFVLQHATTRAPPKQYYCVTAETWRKHGDLELHVTFGHHEGKLVSVAVVSIVRAATAPQHDAGRRASRRSSARARRGLIYISVLHAVQKKGHGRRLIEHIEAQDHEGPLVVIASEKSPSMRFWDKVGFGSRPLPPSLQVFQPFNSGVMKMLTKKD